MTDWLNAFLAWFIGLIRDLFSAVWDWATDLFIALANLFLDVVLEVINAIPVPEFLTSGLNVLFSGLGGDVLFFVGLLGIPQAFLILAAGYGFRLIRKLVTLGQW